MVCVCVCVMGGGGAGAVGVTFGVGVYWGEIIRFLKRIAQKPTQVSIPNLFNR